MQRVNIRVGGLDRLGLKIQYEWNVIYLELYIP